MGNTQGYERALERYNMNTYKIARDSVQDIINTLDTSRPEEFVEKCVELVKELSKQSIPAFIQNGKVIDLPNMGKKGSIVWQSLEVDGVPNKRYYIKFERGTKGEWESLRFFEGYASARSSQGSKPLYRLTLIDVRNNQVNIIQKYTEYRRLTNYKNIQDRLIKNIRGK